MNRIGSIAQYLVRALSRPPVCAALAKISLPGDGHAFRQRAGLEPGRNAERSPWIVRRALQHYVARLNPGEKSRAYTGFKRTAIQRRRLIPRGHLVQTLGYRLLSRPVSQKVTVCPSAHDLILKLGQSGSAGTTLWIQHGHVASTSMWIAQMLERVLSSSGRGRSIHVAVVVVGMHSEMGVWCG